MDALAQNNTNLSANNQQIVDNQDDLNCQLSANDTAETSENLTLLAGVDALTPPTKTPKTITSAPIKYAPVITPVKGTYNLYCIALKWLDNPGPSLGSVTNDGHLAAEVYHRLSGGYINFNVIAKVVSVNYTHVAKNLGAAESQAKKIATANQKNTYPNIYVMFNHGAKAVSEGGGDTAHLIGTLGRDVLHEIGHCRPFKLGHSGKFDSNGKYLQYDDGTSFMGRFSSTSLTAPQLYYLGWLPQNKVAEYDIGTPATEYNIEQLNSGGTSDSLQAVYIPRDTGKPLFLSMPKVNNQFMFALHLANHQNSNPSNGGGSERVQVFANTAEYDNLMFEKVSASPGYTTIRISPKPTM